MSDHSAPSTLYSNEKASESLSQEFPTSQETGQFSESPAASPDSAFSASESVPHTSEAGLVDYPSSSTVIPATPVFRPKGLNTAESKKAKRKKLAFRSALVALTAVGALAVAGFRLHGKVPVGLYLWDQDLALFEEVIQALAVDPSPDCFVKHESFTADTPDALAAQKSIQEWLNKASMWAEAAKNRTDKAAQPEDWEISILRGALVCRNIPHLEAAAALSPYNAYAHGFSRESSVCDNNTAEPLESVQPEDEERSRVRKAKDQLRSKKLDIASWIGEVRERLAELEERYLESREDTPTDREELDEILSAQKFYKLLAAHAESFAIPPDNAPLKVLDSFVSHRSASAAKAASALPIMDLNNPPGPLHAFYSSAGEESRTPGSSTHANSASPSFGIDLAGVPAAVRAQLSKNRFIPPWVAQVFLAPRNTELSAPFRLRLAVESSGIPFSPTQEACFAEFNELVQSTIEFEKGYQDLQSLPMESPKRKEEQRRLRVIQMHSEMALAAFRIPSLERRLTAIRLSDPQSPHDVRRLTRTLTTAYDKLVAVSHKWVSIVEKGEFDLTPSKTTNLTTVLKNVSNFAILSKNLQSMQFRAQADKKFAEQNDAHIKRTAAIAAIAQVQIMGATKRGELHATGLVASWWAHIR